MSSGRKGKRVGPVISLDGVCRIICRLRLSLSQFWVWKCPVTHALALSTLSGTLNRTDSQGKSKRSWLTKTQPFQYSGTCSVWEIYLQKKINSKLHLISEKFLGLKDFWISFWFSAEVTELDQEGSASRRFLGPGDSSSCTDTILSVSDTLGIPVYWPASGNPHSLHSFPVPGPVLPKPCCLGTTACLDCVSVSPYVSPWAVLAKSFCWINKGPEALGFLLKVSAPGMVLNILAK